MTVTVTRLGSRYNPEPAEDYYLPVEDEILNEVVDRVLVRYGKDPRQRRRMLASPQRRLKGNNTMRSSKLHRAVRNSPEIDQFLRMAEKEYNRRLDYYEGAETIEFVGEVAFSMDMEDIMSIFNQLDLDYTSLASVWDGEIGAAIRNRVSYEMVGMVEAHMGFTH